MCVFSGKADAKGTKVAVYHMMDGTQVVYYQNAVVSLEGEEDFGWGIPANPEDLLEGGVAMILHVPAKALTPESLIDTSKFPNILDDMEAALNPMSKEMAYRGRSLGDDSDIFIVEMELYTSVAVNRATVGDVMTALERVAPARRPVIGREQLGYYLSIGFPLVLACFNNREMTKSNPIGVHFTPLRPDLMMAMGVEEHDGGIPNFNVPVRRDHQVIFAVEGMTVGDEVTYTDEIPDSAMTLLPKRVLGHSWTGIHPNGDFVVKTNHVLRGDLSLAKIIAPSFPA